MSRETALFAVVISAFVTFALRLLPFVLFSRRETPKAISYLGKVLPSAVIAMLVVYCLKGVSFGSAKGFVPEMIASLVVAGLQLWKKNSILSIFIGTIVYMVLVQFVFI